MYSTTRAYFQAEVLTTEIINENKKCISVSDFTATMMFRFQTTTLHAFAHRLELSRGFLPMTSVFDKSWKMCAVETYPRALGHACRRCGVRRQSSFLLDSISDDMHSSLYWLTVSVGVEPELRLDISATDFAQDWYSLNSDTVHCKWYNRLLQLTPEQKSHVAQMHQVPIQLSYLDSLTESVSKLTVVL